MATRASRRKKLSLHEEPNSLVESSPPVVMTTRKHHTRRHKENNPEDEAKVIGKFVKYPQDSPINKTTQSEIEHKSTRKTRKALISKDNIFNEDGEIQKNEEPVKQSRNTRSRKNMQVNVTDDIDAIKEETERTESMMKTKNKHKKKKALERSNAIDGDAEHLNEKPLHESIESCGNSSDSNHTRKTKKKVKSRKGAMELEQDVSKEKQDFTKTAGSFNKDSSQKSLEVTFTSTNTSADSFHSAAGSPARGILDPLNRDESLKSDKTLDTTYDKDTINSTITITSNDNGFNNGHKQKKAPYSPNKVSLSKRQSDSNKKHSIQNCSTPNSVIDIIPGKNLDGTAEVEPDEKFNTTYDKSPQRRSSRVSNHGGNGKMSEDIFNATVVLVDSSVDITRTSVNDSIISKSHKQTPSTLPAKIRKSEITPNKIETSQVSATSNNDNKSNNSVAINTPKLVREGTFTMDSPKMQRESVSPSKALPSGNGSTDNIVTPVKKKSSIPGPGSTPYHSRQRNTRTMEKSVSVLNVTRSIEKENSLLRRSSSTAAARPPKVMFCSPVWNEVRDTERKSRIIKSSMKGSNKSFVIEESATTVSSSRKRSYTQSDVDDINAKRKKLGGDELVNSVNRLSRSKQQSIEKMNQSTCKTPVTPTRSRMFTPGQSKSETKPTSVRSKLPDFAAVHKRAFDKMESLSECQERKAQRAKQMLQFPPTGLYTLDGRRSPTVTSIPVPKAAPEKQDGKQAAPSKARAPLAKAASATTAEKPNRTYTRFGFKLQTDFNPFSIPSNKPAKTKIPSKDKSNITIPNQTMSNSTATRFNDTVLSIRREKSKQTLKREKSSTVITENRKKENRDILKGVRTNRRFELQMKSRNMNM